MCVYPISDARDVFSPLGSRFWMVLRAGEVARNPQSDHHVFAGRGISASNAGYSQGAAAARTRLDQRAISGVSTIVGSMVGSYVDGEALVRDFDACLLTAKAFAKGPKAWAQFDNRR